MPHASNASPCRRAMIDNSVRMVRSSSAAAGSDWWASVDQLDHRRDDLALDVLAKHRLRITQELRRHLADAVEAVSIDHEQLLLEPDREVRSIKLCK